MIHDERARGEIGEFLAAQFRISCLNKGLREMICSLHQPLWYVVSDMLIVILFCGDSICFSNLHMQACRVGRFKDFPSIVI